MASEDITFCFSECENMKCIRLTIPHSFEFLEGTEDCLKGIKTNERTPI